MAGTAARLAFIAVGGVTALLIGMLLLPAGRLAALSGGLLYALFWPAIVSSQSVGLEGLSRSTSTIRHICSGAAMNNGRQTSWIDRVVPTSGSASPRSLV